MADEIKIFIQVWIAAVLCLCYCHQIASRIPNGVLRLLSLSPVIFIFFLLPLSLNSLRLCVITTYFLSWLANFRLLLFAFDQGPLSPPPTILRFICVAALPIKPKFDSNRQIPRSEKRKSNPLIVLAVKVAILGFLFRAYDYSEKFGRNLLLILYCLHLYLELELVLSLTAVPARAILGIEIEPQFNEPYLSTSLQDFWGRRWNLMVPSVLRPVVYLPTRRFSEILIGRRRARIVAIVASFTVSGLMHELLYYYLMRVQPTWEVTRFFVLQGSCMAAEIQVKIAVAARGSGGGRRLHPVVSGMLTLGFVISTGFWLFFPQVFRNGAVDGFIEEGFIVVNFFKRNLLKAFGF